MASRIRLALLAASPGRSVWHAILDLGAVNSLDRIKRGVRSSELPF